MSVFSPLPKNTKSVNEGESFWFAQQSFQTTINRVIVIHPVNGERVANIVDYMYDLGSVQVPSIRHDIQEA